MSPVTAAAPEVAFRGRSSDGARLRGDIRGTRPTPRELQAVELAGDASLRGRSVRRVVADELGISPHTVDSLLRTLYRRLGVHSIEEAIFALREDLA